MKVERNILSFFMAGLILSCTLLFYATSEAGEYSLKPRVSVAKLQGVKAEKNPIAFTRESLAIGKKVYEEKGICFNCHGMDGRGDGPAGAAFNPGPANFTDVKFQEARSDGEIFWAIKNGTPGGMLSFDGMISKDEMWHVVNYIRSLGGKTVAKK